MNTVTPAKLHLPSGPVAAMGFGLVLSIVTLVALVIDQVSTSSIADHVDALYAPFNLHPDPNLLFGILYVTGGIGVLLWVTMIWCVREDKRWVRVMASTIFVVAASFALLVLLVSEYGTRIFPTPWGLVGLLPSIAGLVAVTLMWTRSRPVISQS